MTKYVIDLRNDKLFTKASMLKGLVLLTIIVIGTANAQQLSFLKKETSEQVTFFYQWQDIQQESRTFSFTLDKALIFDKYRQFKEYKPNLAQQYVNRAIVKHIRKHPIPKVQLSVKSQAKQNQLQLRSNDRTALSEAEEKIRQLEQRFTKKYLQQHYYHFFNTPAGEVAIKPDHVRIALDSSEDLKPLKSLVLESVTIKNIRKVTNYVLGFVQSIPYATLENRVTSSGAGFNPPLKLLWENKGDCDSKVTLTAALLRMLMPRIRIALIFIEGHALIGLGVPAVGDEFSISHDNHSFVLAEPTGPSLLPLGEIAGDSEQAILSGYYVVEELLN
ncbi:hypothetical protein [Thalassotalea fusca]